MADRWITTYELDGRGGQVTATQQVQLGCSVEIGREGEMPLAVAVQNTAISRLATTVTAVENGWQIHVSNRAGAVLHPWGQPPQLARGREAVNWPLVGIRMLPDSATSQHWVLLEADDLPVTRAGAMPSRAGSIKTDVPKPPRDLPPGEQEALHMVFSAALAWPPLHPSEPLLLKQGASRIGISVPALQGRLRSARARAERSGLDRDVAVTDPSYLYLLVRAGFLALPAAHHHRPSNQSWQNT